MTVSFAPSALDQVASLLRARRKRRISDAERERLRSMGFAKAV
jgi:hypothetical protein